MFYWDNRKYNVNYSNGLYRDYRVYILGLYWDNGKENGNYRDYRDGFPSSQGVHAVYA